ncbi:MAG TPA: hypothetical protein VNC78_05710 [Actinomycetota bacterium]|nr:hypothetical protein [Actinomycetota bacterium]
MLKKLCVLALALSLVASPAMAGGKKKAKPKGPAPWTSPDVTLVAPHPVLYGQSGTVVGVTAQEFINTCAIPSSNGVDAYVFEVPADYKGLQATVKAIGVGGPAGYDLDIYLFDESCGVTFAYNAANTDETGTTTTDTAFILIHNYAADPVLTAHVELEPYTPSKF